MSEDWFRKLYPKAKLDFPPALKLELGKPVKVTFLDKEPRLVRGGMGRLTGVIEVTVGKERQSLYLSNVDLARGIRNLQNKAANLEGVKARIEWVRKGRYNKFDIAKL